MWYKIKRIMIWDKQVRPYRYNPWSNTLLYLPLEKDSLDYSGNNISTTPSNITYASLWWVMCANANGSSSKIELSEFFTSWITAGTISFFRYFTWTQFSWAYYNLFYFRTQYCFTWADIRENGSKFDAYIVNGSWDTTLTSNYSNIWKNLILTFWDGKLNAFIDWVKVKTDITCNNNRWPQSWWDTRYVFRWSPVSPGNRWKWWARELLLEKRKRTDDECVNYYNNMKSQLWIS